jgi:ribosomal protein S7
MSRLGYSVELLDIYIRLLSKKGQKNTGRVLMVEVSRICQQKYNIDFLSVLLAATMNALPCFETKRKRKGGTTILVPFPLRKNRQLFLAVKTILMNAKKRSKNSGYSLSIINEIIETVTCESTSYKMRQSSDKKAESNRAYSFLRWN